MLTDLRQFFETLLLAVAALLPIVNPLGGAPIYLAKTTDLSPEAHTELSRRVAINCFMLLLVSTFIGAYVLDFFGLSIPAVQVAGGAVVCAIGWSLLNEPDQSPVAAQDAVRADTPSDLARRAFYPLTMPLTVGPGSISVAITLGANPPADVRSLITTSLAHIAGITIVVLIVFLCYRYADPILRRLGDVGTAIVTRLTAFILLCIGVQILWNGIAGLAKTLHGLPLS
ncbi:MAG TPA: MarC family protein [Casimicrobiaceae bacterium]|jgi:multiple antibiotic resistance protein